MGVQYVLWCHSILEFVGNSKVREGREIKKQLNERLGLIKALVEVERFKNKQTDDGSEVLFDDDFSSIGLFDDADEIPSTVKRKRLSTLATVTVGAAQERQDKTKRKIKSTNRFGTNVAVKDRQHLYAIESRTYQQNRALLMASAKKTIPETPTFPVNISSSSKPGIAPLIPNQILCYLRTRGQLPLTQRDVPMILRRRLHLPCPQRPLPVQLSMQTLVTQVSLLSMTLVIMAPTEQAPSLHPFLISRTLKCFRRGRFAP
jgi:hypothetical protein